MNQSDIKDVIASRGALKRWTAHHLIELRRVDFNLESEAFLSQPYKWLQFYGQKVKISDCFKNSCSFVPKQCQNQTAREVFNLAFRIFKD